MEGDLVEKALTFTMEKLENVAGNLHGDGDFITAKENSEIAQDPDAETRKEALKIPGSSSPVENGAMVNDHAAELINKALTFTMDKLENVAENLQGDGDFTPAKENPDALNRTEASITPRSSPIENGARVNDYAAELANNGGIVKEGDNVENAPTFTMDKLENVAENIHGDGDFARDNDYASELVNDVMFLVDSETTNAQMEKLIDVEKTENGNYASDNGDEDIFRVGDFVWGKLESHHWWPGQIYNPSHASDCALKIKQKNSMLVAYFGDNTFSWCTPSQLKTFEDHFDEMAKQTNSYSFVNAVSKALDEFSRLVESKMSVNLEPQLTKNIGIKDGIYVPESRTLLIAVFNPDVCLDYMKRIAVNPSLVNLLDLAVLKSRLSVFYRWKGIERLKICDEPQLIPGLEDKKNVLVPKRGAREHDKYTRIRNVNELFDKKNEDEILNPKQVPVKSFGDCDGIVDLKIRKRPRIKTTRGPGAPRLSLRLMEEPNDSDRDRGEFKEETEKPFSRERKRRSSKYLSPPYTDLNLWELKKAARQPLKVSNESIQKKRSAKPCDVAFSGIPKQDEAEDFNVMPPGGEVLSRIRAAAVNPVKGNDSIGNVKGFVSLFRSSVYNDGSNHESSDEGQHSRKRTVHDREAVYPDTKNVGVKKTNVNESSAVLCVKFSPGFYLPTKKVLVKIYSKFGELNKNETKIYGNDFCARVVFMRAADAEKALNSSRSADPFGGTALSFCIENPSTASEGCEPMEIETYAADLAYVKEKLEVVSKMLEDSEAPNPVLVTGMKGLLEKVSAMAGGSSSRVDK